jgi:membrane protease subunit HflK
MNFSARPAVEVKNDPQTELSASRPRASGRGHWWDRLRGMFNLNDPRWGRSDDAPSSPSSSSQQPSQDGGNSGNERPDSDLPPPSYGSQGSGRGRQQGPNQGPPDLDELWRDFTRKLSGNAKSAGFGIGLIGGIALLIWLGTGFFIVQEGQQAVVTQFGRYHSTVGAGFNWRLPYPIQRHELVFVTQIRSVDVGRDVVIRSTGLRESAMLTEDENIVEIKFAVQYRLNDARAFLFESRDPSLAVVQAAETAVREVVGKMKMDLALAEERDQIAPRVRTLMQQILDRYKVGIEIVGINLQQGGVRPPEQVQAAFDDVLKAGQERERLKNEAQAYANDVVPRAVGTASRLKEEAEAYKARIVAQAQGDAQRFRSVLNEYQRAPQVTRDRLYLETMQEIYGNVTKVLVETKQGSNLLYLPLDKLLQQGADPAASFAPQPLMQGPSSSSSVDGASTGSLNDARSRANQRSRERETR